MTTSQTPNHNGLPAFDRIALVLQGGGALGSYQAGVVEGLAEAGIEPDWIAGISIGALNAAVIAGNPPKRRVECLRAFWTDLCSPVLPWPGGKEVLDFIDQLDGPWRMVFSAFDAWHALLGGQPAFFTPRTLPPLFSTHGSPASASFYDTAALQATLERHADFDRINHRGAPQVSVGAVQVRTGNLVYFENRHRKLDARHFMASGALPPGFPAVDIDGEFYWDGGLVSNTPLAHVVRGTLQRDTLVFQVDLWSATGNLPRNLMEVQVRQKDIQYSSRTRFITDAMAREQHQRKLLRRVLAQVPQARRESDPWCRRAAELADDRVVKVIHLIHRDLELNGHFKDYDFGPATLQRHWRRGLDDARASLAQPGAMERPASEEVFATRDVHRATPPPLNGATMRE